MQFSVRSKQNKASFKSNLFIYRWSLTLSMAGTASKLSKPTDQTISEPLDEVQQRRESILHTSFTSERCLTSASLKAFSEQFQLPTSVNKPGNWAMCFIFCICFLQLFSASCVPPQLTQKARASAACYWPGGLHTAQTSTTAKCHSTVVQAALPINQVTRKNLQENPMWFPKISLTIPSYERTNSNKWVYLVIWLVGSFFTY